MQPSIDLPKYEEGTLSEKQHLAEAIRKACIQAAIAGYEDASLSGLCHEGAWERAIDAIQSLDLEAIIWEQESHRAGSSH